MTGANSGIGEGVARCFAEAGAKVVINYVTRPDAAEAIVQDIKRAGNEAIALNTDVSNEDDVKAMYTEMFKHYGTIDILCANAGIQLDAPFVEMTLAKWNTVLAVNLTGQFLCAREAAREFIRRGVRPEVSLAAGKIICMSSVHQEIPWAGHANYAASKGGIHMLMRTMAQELAPHKIRVNAIARRHSDSDQSRRLGYARGTRQVIDPDSRPTHWDTGRHRQGGGMVGLGRFRLCAGDDTVRRWRHDLISRFRNRRVASRSCK